MLPVPEEKKEITLEQVQEELNSENPQVKAQAILEISNRLYKPSLGKIRNLLKNDVNPAVKGTAASKLG
ncbi:HEAT repeat domain-containing protein, partial [Leptospira interrogans serovar Pomona]|nr:HEAT repeat domain-containing protein [Leptospira interrogans serovar Pomona]